MEDRDLEVYTDGSGKKYTKDSLVSGIYRFVNFTSSNNGSGGGGYGGSDGGDGSSGGGGYVTPGKFAPADGIFHIDEATKWIYNAAYDRYIKGKCGKCAKFVRSAIDIGFRTNPNGGDSYTGRHNRPTWAWKYIDFLPKIGFKFIDVVDRSLEGKHNGKYTPQEGDIACYQKNGDPSVPGHICMFACGRWCSDYKQNSAFAYGGTKQAYIFRFQEK